MKFATVLLLLGLVAVAQAGRTMPSARKLLDETSYSGGNYDSYGFHHSKPYGSHYSTYPFERANAAYANADGHAYGDGAIVYTETFGQSGKDYGSSAKPAVDQSGKDFGSLSKSASLAANDYDYFGLGLSKGRSYGEYTHSDTYTDAGAFPDGAYADASSNSASCTGDGCSYDQYHY